ncbi:hypothetical protein [uncultured Thermanaerothrix sp.]|uniref:WD40 repeat domain-containing protein n=1 Tax=uncultured Thermanaerothrix sp. TaxID=1195149 RepID=UPI00260505B8|nr:hypothetical protein [uncultured Thermanaerothrix sp.]
MTSAQERLDRLRGLLRDPSTWINLPSEWVERLLLRGTIAFLEAEDEPEADEVLGLAVRICPDEEMRALALKALVARAMRQEYESSRTILFSLAVDEANLDAVALIQAYGLRCSQPRLQALFSFLYEDVEAYHQHDSTGVHVTEAYLEAQDLALRTRLLEAARRQGWEEWIEIVRVLEAPTAERLEMLVERYARFTHLRERQLILHFLDQLAQQGNEIAQEALCTLYLKYEDEQVLQILRQRGYLPRDAAQRALFFFLTQQWERYEGLDLDQRLLAMAYERATPLVRRRLLNLSRYTGRVGWLSVVQRGQTVRGIRDLSDADWQGLVAHLARAERWSDLWRIAQVAPPYWGVHILHVLKERSWQPAVSEEQGAFSLLVELAEACRLNPPQMQRVAVYRPPVASELMSFAVNREGTWMAGGTADATLWVWELETSSWPARRMGGSLGQPRVLTFSPEGDYLVGGFNDHAIRIFRLSDGALVKTLTGHAGLIRALVMHPAGRVLFSAGFDGTIRVWRFPFGPQLRLMIAPDGEELFGLGVSDDGERLISAGSAGVIRVWRWADGALITELPDQGETLLALAVSSGQLGASYSRDGWLRAWNIVNGRRLWEVACEGTRLSHLCFHPEEQLLFSTDLEGAIAAWNIFSGKIVSRLTEPASPGVGLWIHPQGHRLFSAHASGEINVWDLEMLLLARSVPRFPAALQIPFLEQKWTKSTTESPGLKVWLRYLLELYRWLARFDVEIVEPVVLEVGEFDIQL